MISSQHNQAHPGIVRCTASDFGGAGKMSDLTPKFVVGPWGSFTEQIKALDIKAISPDLPRPELCTTICCVTYRLCMCNAPMQLLQFWPIVYMFLSYALELEF